MGAAIPPFAESFGAREGFSRPPCDLGNNAVAPSAGVLEWRGQQQGGELFTTTVTLAKIRYGIELRGRPLPPRYLSPRNSADRRWTCACETPGPQSTA